MTINFKILDQILSNLKKFDKANLLIVSKNQTRNDVQDNKKTKHYKLTKKGLGLKPILEELGKWSTSYVKNEHPKMLSKKTFLEITHSN